MSYQIIYADPPWKFASNSVARPGRNAMRHYPCMTDAELKEMAIPAAADALLLMWATAPMMVRSLAVMDAWRFKYVSQMVWVKSRIATGYWVRNRHEILVVAKRGKFPCKSPAPFSDSVIEAPTREHSRKPDVVYDMIEAAWPDERKLELFARQTRDGWDQFGNEIDKFDGVPS